MRLQSRFVRISLGLALVVLIVATLSLGASAKIKLKLGAWLDLPDWIQPTKDLIKEYEKENPNVEVELFHMVWNGYHEKLLTMVAGGVIPDVMVLSRLYMPTFALQDIIMPVDDFIVKDTSFDLKKDVTEVASGTFRGKVYGIPIWGGPAVLSFNADIFDKYGVMSPLVYAKNQNWNWGTFLEVCKKLTRDANGDGRIDQYGVGIYIPGINHWVTAVRQNGGDVLNADGTKCVVNTPEAAGGIQYLLDLMYKYKVAPAPGVSGSTVIGTVWSTSAINIAIQEKDRYKMDIAPMPAGKAGYSHIAGGCPVCVSKTTKHPEEAYKLAKWFALEIDRKVNSFPASQKTFNREFIVRMMKYFSDPKTTLMIALTSGRPEPHCHPKAFDLDRVWAQVLAETQAGKISAEVTVKRLEEVTNAVLRSK